MKKNIGLILLCIAIVVGSLFLGRNGEFNGADGEIEVKIEELNGDYEPWAAPMWEPPSGEIESFLFCVQAAIGAGFIGYYVGIKKGASKAKAAKVSIDSKVKEC